MNKSRKIPLTRGFFAIVDSDDFEYVNQWTWYYSNRGYAVRRDYKTKKDIMMHRLINNTPDNLYTDHINGNKLDNRKGNLRNCTNTQNQWNQKPRSGTIKGVRQRKNGSYEVTVKMNYKGTFSNFDAAINAYNYYASQEFGDFAWLNDINIHMDKSEFERYRMTVKKTSEYVGVSWNKKGSKWEAYANIDGRQTYVGCFENERDAALARNTFIDMHNSRSVKNEINF